MRNKIGWCNATFNPVWGCLNHCSYCYARVIAKRFGGIRFREEWEYRTEHNMDSNYFKLNNSLDLVRFKPTFLYSQFDKKFPKKPQRIFVGSMSEIYYWEDEWLEKVLEKVKLYPQHIFQFLTKFPEVYKEWVFPENCWLGVTITEEGDFDNRKFYNFLGDNANLEYNNIKFISFEPLSSEILSLNLLRHSKWIILGAETGKRKGKIIPKKEWLENIVNYCKWNNIPVYLKDSLKNIYPEKIKMFPEVK